MVLAMLVRLNLKAITGLIILISLVSGCKESADLEWTQSRSQSSIKGQFLTQDPDTIDFPVKVLFAIDCSLSMGQTVDGNEVGADPAGERFDAVKDFISKYNVNENISFDIMLWSTSVFARTENDAGNNGFTKNTTDMQDDVWANQRNDTQTNYLGTLAEIYKDIQNDIQQESSSENLQRTKYIVVFLSDGIPQDQGTVQDDDEIAQEVLKIREMTEVAGVGGFAFHTFLLLGGFASGEDGDTLKEYATQVLSKMANNGDGTFNEFENAEAINFLSFIDLRLAVEYLLKYVIAYNMNTIPGTELIALDTDGDGLSDEKELEWGSYPWKRDSDDDGASDYVEYSLTTPDHVFNPLTFIGDPDGPDGPMEENIQDNNCTAGIGGIWPDTDQDLLNDCEEDLIGTNRRVADTDGDGIPDGLEFLAGTNIFNPEDTVDTDLDGFPNPIEIRQHTNISSDDPKLRERYAYQYSLTDQGKVVINQGTESGQVQSVRKLYTLGVDNIDIMDVGVDPTTNKPYPIENYDEVDFVPGENTVQVFVAQVPADRPESAPYFSKVEFKVNIKSDKNASGNKVMEFHSDELFYQAGDFSLPLNEMN
jgi:hypothetical protein